LRVMTYEIDELRRELERCFCPIYASGTLDRKFRRTNTERTSREEAKIVVRAWEESGSWSGKVGQNHDAVSSVTLVRGSSGTASV
jgi:hypothetical protein